MEQKWLPGKIKKPTEVKIVGPGKIKKPTEVNIARREELQGSRLIKQQAELVESKMLRIEKRKGGRLPRVYETTPSEEYSRDNSITRYESMPTGLNPTDRVPLVEETKPDKKSSQRFERLVNESLRSTKLHK